MCQSWWRLWIVQKNVCWFFLEMYIVEPCLSGYIKLTVIFQESHQYWMSHEFYYACALMFLFSVSHIIVVSRACLSLIFLNITAKGEPKGIWTWIQCTSVSYNCRSNLILGYFWFNLAGGFSISLVF